MIIENPLSWEQTRQNTNAPLNLNGSANFWNTVEHYGLTTYRNGSPEFSSISFVLKKDEYKGEESIFYLNLSINQDIYKHLDGKIELDNHYFEHVYFASAKGENKENHFFELAEEEEANVLKDIGVISEFGKGKKVESITFKLKDNIGLQVYTTLELPYIEARFIELKKIN